MCPINYCSNFTLLFLGLLNLNIFSFLFLKYFFLYFFSILNVNESYVSYDEFDIFLNSKSLMFTPLYCSWQSTYSYYSKHSLILLTIYLSSSSLFSSSIFIILLISFLLSTNYLNPSVFSLRRSLKKLEYVLIPFIFQIQLSYFLFY